MTETSYPENFEEIQKEIDRAQGLRGWFVNSYAQIEYFLGDLIVRSFRFSEYRELGENLPHGAPDRVKRVRKILKIAGPYSVYELPLSSILDRFSERHETRNLFAHGFCEFLFTKAGDRGMHFRKWHRDPDRDRDLQNLWLQRTFRLGDLQRETRQLTDLAQEALMVFRDIEGQLGPAR